MSRNIPVEFEGETVSVVAGESLGAALTAHGVLDLRTTRLGRDRGIYCGMGVCQDCLVEVDGVPNQRACMTKVDRPMQVRREAHLRPLPTLDKGVAPKAGTGARVERPEVLVIGAGPGGLSAAIAARRSGASVVVLDERSLPGGQYYKQISVEDAVPGPDTQHCEGAALIAEARDLGVDLRSGIEVWGAFEPREFVASDAATTTRFEPQAAIVAAGAYERGWPVPGWTLPGVMTTGAAQTLWRSARRLPGRRVLIAGNGPLNLQLASELIAGGAKVSAVVEAAARPGPSSIGPLLTMAYSAPDLIRQGLVYHAARRKAGTAMIHGEVVARVDPSPNGGLLVTLRPTDAKSGAAAAGRRIETDILCLGYGFEPSNELLRVLGCGHDFDPRRRQLVTRRDAAGETDIAGVFALGDCTGLGGAKAALAEGTVVGMAVAERLGHRLSSDTIATRARAERSLVRHRRFQAALWQLYAAPGWSEDLADRETLLCRCEEVSFGEIQTALAEGLTGIGAIKRRTRLGMGRCQGRTCAPILDAMLSARAGIDRSEFSGFAPRVPVKPVSIAAVARLEDL